MTEAPPSELRGLTADEVASRVAAGLVNTSTRQPVRTLGEIIRANVLTWVNAIVGTLFALLLVSGRAADGLFVGVIVSNSLIGIVQELRARRTLERLAVINAPRARVRRSGEERVVALDEVVADDVVVVATGDQLGIDGPVLESNGLEVDESLLTGEADPVGKGAGDEVLSGSFVVAGSGVVRATRIGADSYASTLATEARRFRLAPSGLRADVDRVLRWQMIVIPPIALLLLIRQLRVHDDWRDAVTDMVAAAVAMVPAGLALLISIAFIVGVLELARRRALAKELASVELLARVDTVCLDKTGTITTGAITYARAVPLGDADADWLRSALATLAASDPNPNSTLRAIGRGNEAAHAWPTAAVVPFSSARKWAAVNVPGQGSLFLGAPEMLLADDDQDHGDDDAATSARDVVADCTRRGERVLLVTRSEHWDDDRLPPALRPAGVVVLEDALRSDAGEIVAYFVAQDVALKVISGDSARTVVAVAQRAGIPNAERWADARELPDDETQFADAVDAHVVFGRVSPHQKQAMVRAMQQRGHVVAMTGDGVNDVLALKDADAGIAMGSGSAASRAVAQLVLLDDRFATLPVALAQGRRVVNNIERVANLFLTKTSYAITLAVLVGVVGSPFPFLPRQQTLVDTFSIGLPGFVLALAPAPAPIRAGLLRRVLTFAVPAGVLTGAVCFGVFEAVSRRSGSTLDEARTCATFTLVAIALVVLVVSSRPLAAWKVALATSMLVLYLVVTAIGPLRRYFRFDVPDEPVTGWYVAIAACLGGALVVLVRRIADSVLRSR